MGRKYLELIGDRSLKDLSYYGKIQLLDFAKGVRLRREHGWGLSRCAQWMGVSKGTLSEFLERNEGARVFWDAALQDYQNQFVNPARARLKEMLEPEYVEEGTRFDRTMRLKNQADATWKVLEKMDPDFKEEKEGGVAINLGGVNLGVLVAYQGREDEAVSDEDHKMIEDYSTEIITVEAEDAA